MKKDECTSEIYTSLLKFSVKNQVCTTFNSEMIIILMKNNAK